MGSTKYKKNFRPGRFYFVNVQYPYFGKIMKFKPFDRNLQCFHRATYLLSFNTPEKAMISFLAAHGVPSSTAGQRVDKVVRSVREHHFSNVTKIHIFYCKKNFVLWIQSNLDRLRFMRTAPGKQIPSKFK